ncbi:MAG: NrfD/PsrC family molybdoenzyme membrane anchor subunit [Gammaproteobacteria bacterium]|jgi:molybdopterin-containing oxidoreductase family membrane subunit
MALLLFFRDAFRELFRGSLLYWGWIVFLWAIIALGVWEYIGQLNNGLVVTNMSNQVSWGFYISNFTFLVGVAAAAVMLVIPAYIFDRKDIRDVVLLGDTMAVTAVMMAMLFVIVDIGRPDRIWHMIPLIGRFNFPASLLAWDVIVLSGYLLLNLGISFYLLFSHYQGREVKLKTYLPFIMLAIFWAISIHTVTAFLYSANTGRLFWHNALLAPRFIASAFCSGPALAIIILQIVRKLAGYPVRQSAIDTLRVTMTVALQITLFFVIAELFTEFYSEGADSASARYLFFGLHGAAKLTPWIWTALALLVIAVTILMMHNLRRKPVLFNIACVLTVIGVWIEKGMGLVIPGYIPTPMGEIYEYLPNSTEVMISLGIWGIGLLTFTLLAKAGMAIERGQVRLREDIEEELAGLTNDEEKESLTRPT